MIRSFCDKIPHCKHPNDDEFTQTLTVIRNFTLEPHFDQALYHYSPGLRIEYRYFDQCLREKTPIANDVLIVLHLPYLLNDLYYQFYCIDPTAQQQYITQHAMFLETQIRMLIEQCCEKRIYFALFAPTERRNVLHGQFSFDQIATDLNSRMVRLAEQSQRLTLIDTVTILHTMGFDHYYSPTGIYTTDSVMSRAAVNSLAHAYSSHKYCNDMPVKCIVLDCDNVLWGGIIDEAGINGITLSGNGIGRAYKDFQRELLKLKAQGFILCICSKNDEDDVRSVFETHPDMLIRWNDLAAARVSFAPKSQGISELSQILNMPVEEMVFIDDNAYEIHEVSAVHDITSILFDAAKPHKSIAQLYSSGCFCKEIITADDRCRTNRYQSTVKTTQQAQSPDEINKALQTEMELREAVPADLKRVSDLSYRTHQFNMSGLKYDYNELLSMLASPAYKIYILKVKDVYGDLGIVACSVVKVDSRPYTIEGFYVSCRIIGRDMEKQFLEYILESLSSINSEIPVIGYFRETKQNHKYRNFFQRNAVDMLELP